MKKFLKSSYELFLAMAFIVIDLLSKAFFDGKIITVWEGVFTFKSVHNTGAAFSIFTGQTTVLIIISIVLICGFLFYHFKQQKKTVLYSLAFAFTLAGGIGNLIDRIVFGYVRDFLYFEVINFPIFNFADTCLNVGIALFAIWVIKNELANKKVSLN